MTRIKCVGLLKLFNRQWYIYDFSPKRFIPFARELNTIVGIFFYLFFNQFFSVFFFLVKRCIRSVSIKLIRKRILLITRRPIYGIISIHVNKTNFQLIKSTKTKTKSKTLCIYNYLVNNIKIYTR